MAPGKESTFLGWESTFSGTESTFFREPILTNSTLSYTEIGLLIK